MKRIFTRIAIFLLIAASLGGCARNNAGNTSGRQQPTLATERKAKEEAAAPADKNVVPAKEAAAKFPTAVTNRNPSIEGGTLKVALVSSSAFTGVLNPCFYEDSYDAQLLGWFSESLLSFDGNFIADQDGAATYDYNVKAKTVTLHMRGGVKWQDGEPVTLDDLVFAYEVICSRDYEGFRFNETFMNILGVEEYHAGKADAISGLKLSEDKMTLVVHFKEFDPSILAGGFWTNPIPRHYYGDIGVKDMAADGKTRSYPIGFGPFKVKNIVPGESVEFESFDDYWRGKPKLDGVILTVVKPELVPAAMKEGKFDVAEFSTQQYQDYMEPANYKYLGQIQTAFSYTGFKLGKWDAARNENVYNPGAKLADVKLRQAIGYAVDNQAIAQYLYHGLRFLATTVITPRHGAYQNTRLEGYVYDPEKAKRLLDEAGYRDVDGDGYRETPEGKEFTITWATMDGENADIIAQFKIQCWKEVGLRVKLYHGRLTEFNAFYEAVEGDDPAIDMYDAAWSTGYNPNPSVLWGRNSAANYTRYTSNTFDDIIKEISSGKAWDGAFLSQKYKEWQTAFFKEAPAIPTLWRIQLVAVNNRVKNYEDISNDIKQTYHLIELTAKEPIK
ncbi:MAG TPA: oligopeptide ABC transporter substrate-binding protein [Clostridiales bacterium]|nr:oligopeptide ABC transporter substrate-binding protein [Clostridiales bacterium]